MVLEVSSSPLEESFKKSYSEYGPVLAKEFRTTQISVCTTWQYVLEILQFIHGKTNKFTYLNLKQLLYTICERKSYKGRRLCCGALDKVWLIMQITVEL